MAGRIILTVYKLIFCIDYGLSRLEESFSIFEDRKTRHVREGGEGEDSWEGGSSCQWYWFGVQCSRIRPSQRQTRRQILILGQVRFYIILSSDFSLVKTNFSEWDNFRSYIFLPLYLHEICHVLFFEINKTKYYNSITITFLYSKTLSKQNIKNIYSSF